MYPGKKFNSVLKTTAMQLRVPLCYDTKEWIDTVLANFDAFLHDPADCERKASFMAMSFVTKFPGKIMASMPITPALH